MKLINKETISKTAKQLKKELETKSINKKIKHSHILEILTENIAKMSYNDFEKKSVIIDPADLSIHEVSTMESGLKQELMSYGSISKIGFIDDIKRYQTENFNKNIYNYNLVQYMQMYEIINKKNIFPLPIITYEDAFNNIEIFIKDIINKTNQENSKPLDYHESSREEKLEIKELEIIKRKINADITLTSCDELLDSLIKNKNNELFSFDAMTDVFRKEIVRLKGVAEKQINYKNFVKNIEPFHLNFENNKDIKQIEKLKNKSKINKIFFGEELKNEGVINKIINKKKMFHSDIADLEGALYLSGTVSSCFSSTVISLLSERLIRNEGSLLFDLFYDKTLSLKINKIINAVGKKSQLIKIEPEEFLELSKEQIESFVKKKKTVLIHCCEDRELSSRQIDKIIKKAMYVMDIIGNYKKDDGYNIFINNIDLFINNKSESSKIFLKTFHDEKKTNYIKTRFIFRGESFSDTEIDQINFISKCKIHLIMKSDRYVNAISCMTLPTTQTIEQIKRLITEMSCGEFIISKDNKLLFNGNKYKFLYLNLDIKPKTNQDLI